MQPPSQVFNYNNNDKLIFLFSEKIFGKKIVTER